jgi:hypothetical protein
MGTNGALVGCQILSMNRFTTLYQFFSSGIKFAQQWHMETVQCNMA